MVACCVRHTYLGPSKDSSAGAPSHSMTCATQSATACPEAGPGVRRPEPLSQDRASVQTSRLMVVLVGKKQTSLSVSLRHLPPASLAQHPGWRKPPPGSPLQVWGWSSFPLPQSAHLQTRKSANDSLTHAKEQPSWEPAVGMLGRSRAT
jgi:hypothetical protein